MRHETWHVPFGFIKKCSKLCVINLVNWHSDINLTFDNRLININILNSHSHVSSLVKMIHFSAIRHCNLVPPYYLNCTMGTVTNKQQPCNDVCYHSYRHQRILSDDAQYACPDGSCGQVRDVKEELEERCRGRELGVCINTTGDCDDSLVCREDEEATRHTTPVQHNYCSYRALWVFLASF